MVDNIKAFGKMANSMGKGLCLTKKAKNLKQNGMKGNDSSLTKQQGHRTDSEKIFR
jgi:hypothetical protein